MKRIAIITGQHLVSNPRVWKEANLLSSAGYSVTIFSIWYDKDLLRSDLALINASIDYNPGFSLIITWRRFLVVFFSKLKRKFANLFFRIVKKSSIYQIVYSPRTQLRNLTKKNFDLFICHQEPGLLLGVQLIKMGAKVAFDFEDWYSEDYLTQERPVNLLKEAELYAIQNGAFITCPSDSIAAVLRKHQNAKNNITTIYNSFPISTNIASAIKKIPNSLVWFSQNIGTDRGLEPFLESIKNVQRPLQIHLIGKCSVLFKKTLDKLLNNTHHKLIFHPLLSHHELMSFLQQFEIGLALEQNYPFSRRLTITNKILGYLQMGLRVIASNTLGHLELQKDFNDSISFIDLSNSIDIAKKVEQSLFSINNTSFEKFQINYSWEEQGKKIQHLVDECVSN